MYRGSVKLSATGAIAGQQYKWYTDGSSVSSIFTGQDLTTPSISITTDYFVSIFDPATTCESARVKVTATVASVAKPAINASGTVTLCEGTSFLLEAQSGFASYKWSNGSLTQQVLVTSGGKYSVVVNNGACDLPVSDEVTFIFLPTPGAPAITVTGSTTLCNDAFTVLSAPPGFEYYEWSGGETQQTIIVKGGGSYSVKVANVPNCFSEKSGIVTISETGLPCTVINPNPNNISPDIEHATIETAIRGKATLDLVPLISDHNGEDDIVLASLRITEAPPSNAIATIDDVGVLIVDYTQIDFSGSDFITIQVCDLSASCTQQNIDITVAGDITPYNALSPNGDGLNESLYLEFIDIIPDTKNNKVTIFNRWGSAVFEIKDYDNNDRVFKGADQNGKELPNGTYFYRVEFGTGKKTRNGFITLRR
ncbi:MAG: gliding motility-associated C-terminal domain-containing protein [Bacteroidota bacterium]